MLELEDLDARFRRVEDPFVLERTGHLALQTAGTFVGIDKQGLVHDASLTDGVGGADWHGGEDGAMGKQQVR